MPDQPPTPPPSDDSKKPHKKSDQDKAIQNYITESLQMLTTAGKDTEIVPLLSARGYDTAGLAPGLALQDKLDKAFQGRQTGSGGQLSATAAEIKAVRDARSDYADFRGIARGCFTDQGARVALGATGDIPEDFQKFVTAAKASYVAGKKTEYTAKLTLRGYSPATLDGLVTALGTLTSTGNDQNVAEGAAQGSTSVRDKAYDDLRAWMKEFKAVARVALKKRHDLQTKLGL
jgi:hypothetical protein